MDILDDDLVSFLDDEDDQLFNKLYQKLEIGNTLKQDQLSQDMLEIGMDQPNDMLSVELDHSDQIVSTIDGQCDMFEPFIVVECDDEQGTCTHSHIVQEVQKVNELQVALKGSSAAVEAIVSSKLSAKELDQSSATEQREKLIQESSIDIKYTSSVADIFNVLLYRNKGRGGASMVRVCINQPMPKVAPPHKAGERFVGFFDSLQGGRQYYDSDMNSFHNWDKPKNSLLYARYERAN